MAFHLERRRFGLVLPLMLAGLTLAGCQKTSDAAQARAMAPGAVARGVIAVEGGLVPIAAPRDGQVVEVMVEEGAHVARGDLLARLDEARSGLLADEARAQTAQLEAVWRGALARAAAAQSEAARQARLAAGDAASRHDVELARQAAAAASAQSDEAGRAVDVARVRERIASLEQAARAVRAPVDGLVLRRAVAAGATAASGGPPLFVLAPDGPRVVRAELDEAFVGRVQPGAVAWITDANGGGHVFKARVLRISPSYEAAVLDDQPGGRADSRVLGLVLAFEEPNTLRLGQRVLARIGS
jgi:RND family efflux transporter MFP subunit